jgi:peptidoglycan hydrolase CwlO-like protein
MKIATRKTIITAIVTLFCITLIPACQEEVIQESPSDAKRVRILEFERAQLQANHAKELGDLKKRLDECEKKNKNLNENMMKNIEELTDQMLMPMMEENSKLREEIADLKEQIRQLKGS